MHIRLAAKYSRLVRRVRSEPRSVLCRTRPQLPYGLILRFRYVYVGSHSSMQRVNRTQQRTHTSRSRSRIYPSTLLVHGVVELRIEGLRLNVVGNSGCAPNEVLACSTAQVASANWNLPIRRLSSDPLQQMQRAQQRCPELLRRLQTLSRIRSGRLGEDAVERGAHRALFAEHRIDSLRFEDSATFGLVN